MRTSSVVNAMQGEAVRGRAWATGASISGGERREKLVGGPVAAADPQQTADHGADHAAHERVGADLEGQKRAARRVQPVGGEDGALGGAARRRLGGERSGIQA